MSNIIPFTFPETGNPVRTVVIDGEPWFIGTDVARVLELGNIHSSLALLDDDEKGIHSVETPGGDQRVVTVNEPGIYSLILRSRKPQAKAFKRWLTHEVIPSIRKTGSYSVAPAPALPDLTSPAGVLALAEQFVKTARQLVEADRRVAELEPKALVHDTLMATKAGDMLVRQAAKAAGWKERDYRALLLDEKLIYRRQRTCGEWEYDFYAAFAEQFNAVPTVVEHTWGSCAHYTLHVTARGLSFVQMRIEKRRAAMAAAIQGGAR